MSGTEGAACGGDEVGDEVEGKRSRASLIGLDRLLDMGGRFGATAVEGGRKDPKKRVRKVPDCDELLGSSELEAGESLCVGDSSIDGVDSLELDALRLLLFFLPLSCDDADLGRDEGSVPFKLLSLEAAESDTRSPSSSGPVEADTSEGRRRGPLIVGA